jgi:excisionase family DNA binding protein
MTDSKASRDRLWTVQDLAEFLSVPVATVYRWRSTGEGPHGFRIGRYVRYRDRDVQAWLDSCSDGQ